MVRLYFTCTNRLALVINFVDSPNTVITYNSVCEYAETIKLALINSYCL